MEALLGSLAVGDYDTMARALATIGACRYDPTSSCSRCLRKPVASYPSSPALDFFQARGSHLWGWGGGGGGGETQWHVRWPPLGHAGTFCTPFAAKSCAPVPSVLGVWWGTVRFSRRCLKPMLTPDDDLALSGHQEGCCSRFEEAGSQSRFKVKHLSISASMSTAIPAAAAGHRVSKG